MGKIAFTGFAISALTTFQCINTSFQFVDNFTGVLEEIFFFNTLFLIVMHYMNCIPFLIFRIWSSQNRSEEAEEHSQPIPRPSKVFDISRLLNEVSYKKSYFYVYKTNVASPQNPLSSFRKLQLSNRGD